MNPRRSTNRFIRHVLLWAGVLLFFFVGFFTQPEAYPFKPIPFLAELLLASLVTFVGYTYLLIDHLLPLLLRGRYGWFAMGLLGLNLLAILMYSTLGHLQQYVVHWIEQDSSPVVTTLEFTNPFLLPIFFECNLVAGLMVSIRLFDSWRQKQQESQRLEREKLTQELKLLKLQLNPGLLFRTLNSLQLLIRQQDQQAPEVILKLAHFLRYVLYDSQANGVSVKQELTAIEQFVFLQQIVNPVGLEVSLTARGTIDGLLIAPLSLVHLVEQAFTWLPASQGDEPAWISIDLVAGATSLTLKVINPLTDPATDNSKQLADIQKQLYFHYADRHRLQVWQEELIQVVTLSLLGTTGSQETKPFST